MEAFGREVFRRVFTARGGLVVGGAPGLFMVAAALAHIIGGFGVTIFPNIPMNEAVAGMDLSPVDTRAYWLGTYLRRWSFWSGVLLLEGSALLRLGLLWATQMLAQAARVPHAKARYGT